MRVLVVGGSGYLGQFVLKAFSDAYPDTEWVGYTYKSTKLPIPPEDDVHAYEVDLATGEGADACIADATKGGESLDLIVNCAAASSPGWCEKNETAATALNVPSKLLDAMTAASETIGEPLLIHMSTDQVYGGDERRSTEDQCPANPVNAYARSKLKGEEEVAKRWAKHVIFRPSIITGPQPPYAPVNRPLFLDFIVDALKGTKPVGFFVDEWRSPVCAHDIVGHVKIFADRRDDLPRRRLFNCGGPDRLSRVDMALKVAAALGLSDENVDEIDSASVDRGLVSPADISMDSGAILMHSYVVNRGFARQVDAAYANPPTKAEHVRPWGVDQWPPPPWIADSD